MCLAVWPQFLEEAGANSTVLADWNNRKEMLGSHAASLLHSAFLKQPAIFRRREKKVAAYSLGIGSIHFSWAANDTFPPASVRCCHHTSPSKQNMLLGKGDRNGGPREPARPNA